MTKRLPPLFEPLHRVMQRNKSAVKLFQPWQCICSQPISLASQALLLSHTAKVASPSHDRNNLNLALTRMKRPQPYFHVNRKQTLQISTIHTRRQLMKMCTTSTNAKKIETRRAKLPDVCERDGAEKRVLWSKKTIPRK